MPSRAKKLNNSIGSRLKQLRLSKNITQKELAEYLRKSESAVRMWELEKSEPDLETLKYIADFFDVTIDYLFAREIETPQKENPSGKSEEIDETNIEILNVWSSLSLEQKEKALSYLRYLKQEDK